jgi:hypothetical protein
MHGGKLVNRDEAAKIFQGLKDGMFKLHITRHRQVSGQDKHFHGVVLPMICPGLVNAGFDFIEDENDAKAFVSSLFLRKELVNKKTGELTEIIARTKWLTTQEYAEFIDAVIQYAENKLGTIIPYPPDK